MCVLASFPGSTPQLLIAIKSWGVEPGNEAMCVLQMSEYVGGCGRYIVESVHCVHVGLVSH